MQNPKPPEYQYWLTKPLYCTLNPKPYTWHPKPCTLGSRVSHDLIPYNYFQIILNPNLKQA